MDDIETRISALEQKENEHWHAMRAQVRALSFVLDCVHKPLCAMAPQLAPVIVENIKRFEKEARIQNEHADVLRQLSHSREFFEAQITENRRL